MRSTRNRARRSLRRPQSASTSSRSRSRERSPAGVDLHFTKAAASDEECRAIDSALAPFRPRRNGRRVRDRRDALLPVLHAIAARVGWISEGALNEVGRRLTVPPAEAYGVASFYAMFSMKPR